MIEFAPSTFAPSNCSWISFPNLDELLFRTVCALPNASRTGLEPRTASTIPPFASPLARSAAVVARNFRRIFVVSALRRAQE